MLAPRYWYLMVRLPGDLVRPAYRGRELPDDQADVLLESLERYFCERSFDDQRAYRFELTRERDLDDANILELRARWREIDEQLNRYQVSTMERVHPTPKWVDRLRMVRSTAHKMVHDLCEHLASTHPDAKREVGENADRFEKPSRDLRRLEWIARAMLIVRDHPDLTDSAIAKRVPINKAQLSRCQEYQLAAALARDRSALPRGFVSTDPDTKAREFDAIDPGEPD